MNYHGLSDALYAQYRIAFIEGAKAAPYYDTKVIPTIGIGFNLRVESVLDQLPPRSRMPTRATGPTNRAIRRRPVALRGRERGATGALATSGL
jgi:hypothetical protein